MAIRAIMRPPTIQGAPMTSMKIIRSFHKTHHFTLQTIHKIYNNIHKIHKVYEAHKKVHRVVLTTLWVILASLLLSCSSIQEFPFYSPYETLKRFSLPSPVSEVVELSHKKSGARLVLIKNSDPARSFMAGFRTPPYDNTGLFHIFEHAVLAGSRLYPSRSNFLKVAGSTVASFINAMTSSVSTLYPFVTKDPKDFDNLLSVYMDAVFFPKAIEDPRIMKREGWRYEVDPKTNKMSINGIVLSEMKGAFSSPYRSLYYHLQSSVLPDTPYAKSSGGFPDQISTLQFEQIVEAHKKYYHPQNSVIYLYGNIDYKKALATIDKKFLRHFRKTPGFQPPDIPLQKDFNYPTSVAEATYPGPAIGGKDFIAQSYILGPLTPIEEDVANVLLTAFASHSSAPLKLRFLKEGLATSVFLLNPDSQDHSFTFIFEGDKAQKEPMAKVLQEEIGKVIIQGLDEELLESIVNKEEFSHKEKYSNGSHKGMSLGWTVLDNWIKKEQPLERQLDFESHFKKIRHKIKDREFVKDFFKTRLKENGHSRWLVMTPDPLFSKKFNSRLEDRVKKALKIKPLSAYAKEDQIYRQWVASEEPKAITDRTPLLDLSEITVNTTPIPSRKFPMGSKIQKGQLVQQTMVMEFPQNTGGISYVKLFFDLRGVEERNLKNLYLFKELIKETNTQHRSFMELQKKIDLHTGGINFELATYQSSKDLYKFKPTLVVSLSFLAENREKSMGLLKEILTESQFSPKDRVGHLVKEIKAGMTNSFSSRARNLAMGAAEKTFFPLQGAFEDEIRGATFEEYMRSFKVKPQILSSKFQEMLKNIFHQNRFYLVTLTSEEKSLKELNHSINQVQKALFSQKNQDQGWLFAHQKHYDGYAIHGEVQYVFKMASFRKQGLDYNGAMGVYSQYLNTYFLIPRLREQLGAYGARAGFHWNGLFQMSTYRDPNLRDSLDAFSQIVDFMEKQKFDKAQLKPAILGSLKPYYKDKSVLEKADLMTNLYLNDLTWEEYILRQKEILATTSRDFKKINQALASALKESKITVAGNPKKLKKEASFLKKTLPLP